MDTVGELEVGFVGGRVVPVVCVRTWEVTILSFDEFCVFCARVVNGVFFWMCDVFEKIRRAPIFFPNFTQRSLLPSGLGKGRVSDPILGSEKNEKRMA